MNKSDDLRIKKNSFIWNLIACIINASEAVIILAFASRIVSLSDVGILTFGFTIANFMLCICKYGVRNFQVSDVNYKYSFADYFLSRVFTALFAFVSIAIFATISVTFNHYKLYKLVTIILIIFIYQIEGLEDVFVAELQRRNRLDLGSMIFSFRWLITLFIWIIGFIVFKDILLSTFVSFLVDFTFALAMCTILYCKVIGKNKGDKKKVFGILKECFPLCVMITLSIYIPNAAKYAIEMNMNESMQAIYGYISMPIFVLDLVSFVVFQPFLLEISLDWNNEKYKSLIKKIFILSLLLILLSCLYIFIAFIAGIPILSILYGMDLNDYKKCFMILTLGSVSLAFLGMFVTILTVMRKQKIIMFFYGGVSIVLFALLNFALLNSEIMMISIINVLGIIILTILLGLLMLNILLKKKKCQYNLYSKLID